MTNVDNIMEMMADYECTECGAFYETRGICSVCYDIKKWFKIDYDTGKSVRIPILEYPKAKMLTKRKMSFSKRLYQKHVSHINDIISKNMKELEKLTHLIADNPDKSARDELELEYITLVKDINELFYSIGK